MWFTDKTAKDIFATLINESKQELSREKQLDTPELTIVAGKNSHSESIDYL